MPANIFDIKKGGAKLQSKYNKSKIAELLVGYINVPQNQWGSLEKGTHVRYMRTNGKFVRGGFVSGYSTIGNDRTLNIENGFDASSNGYAFWSIRLTLVKAIYAKKMPATASLPERPLINSYSLTSNEEVIIWMNKATKTINSLSKRVEVLENKK